jgi:hypothetical protein
MGVLLLLRPHLYRNEGLPAIICAHPLNLMVTNGRGARRGHDGRGQSRLAATLLAEVPARTAPGSPALRRLRDSNSWSRSGSSAEEWETGEAVEVEGLKGMT